MARRSPARKDAFWCATACVYTWDSAFAAPRNARCISSSTSSSGLCFFAAFAAIYREGVGDGEEAGEHSLACGGLANGDGVAIASGAGPRHLRGPGVGAPRRRGGPRGHDFHES
nr:unnamed protein product [Digitaria exilis]